MSHCLNGAKYNYPVTDQVFLAIVMALKRWKHYFFGKPFMYRTDHASLKWLQT